MLERLVAGIVLFGWVAASPGAIEPVRTWVPPGMPVEVRVTADQPVTLVATSFVGGRLDAPEGVADAGPGDIVDATTIFGFREAGAYLLYAVPRAVEGFEAVASDFIGTPLVVEVRGDDRPGAAAGPLVMRVVPLEFAAIDTGLGSMQLAFYYDSAPATVEHFTSLASGGFYDGLSFHRVVPGYLVQGGDPRGDGSGGPGYRVDAEFSERPFRLGSAALARLTDPIERQGAMPRPVAADSGGSQFFLTLDVPAEDADRLNGRHTLFGRVVDGLDVLEALGEVPVEPGTTTPIEPPLIRAVRIEPVTPEANPYPRLRATEAGDSPLQDVIDEAIRDALPELDAEPGTPAAPEE